MRLIAVAAIVIGSVPVITSPAQAAGCAQPLNYRSQASANLLKVGVLDPGILGLKLPKVADLTLASTQAKLGAADPVRSTAKAEYLSAEVLGLSLPRGPLEATVAQSAPPSHQEPVKNQALSVDLGVAKAGTGELNAHARWADGMACGTQAGPAGAANAALLGVSVLPGSKGALVQADNNISSQSATATVLREGRAASAAAAQISLSSLEFAGGKLTIDVISPPSLVVYATGRAATSVVEYKSPVLEISGAGVPRQQLSGLGKTVDLPIQTSVLGSVLSGLPLPAGLGQTSVLRLTIGDLKQDIKDEKVTASTASLRLQVLVSAASQASVLDLGVGLLDVSAEAPKWTEPNNPPPVDCGTPGCKLPLTGVNVGIAVGAGILLFVAGRFLFVLTARRRA
ncbi:hypothetical protein [Catelliglobosispora koreensis]|uniref:hypothetical protein n=1 Tax=Catelliglobosispora koreensis TaxID=129052 RepID=UPI00039FE2B0|nr:hypothetical protein [Catelliglobosispora koreensis]